MPGPRFGLARLLPLVVLALLGVVPGLGAQVSPGPLAKAHHDLDGTLQCTKCHGSGKDAMPGKCAACHKDIGWLQERGRGLHGQQETKAKTCASCHPDHAGQEFDLIRWPDGSAQKFDHKRAGWTLKQSHDTVKCETCHAPKFQHSPAARLTARKLPGGYAGLDTECQSCHEDVHRGALGDDCTKCHDSGKFTKTPGFDHDTTAYPLTNKHREVKCDKCHLDPRLNPKKDPGGHLVPVYKPVSFETCAACHEDHHKGSLGPKCASCHNTRSFKIIDKDNFDHDRTKYPLKGKHAAVKCVDCHKDFATPLLKKPKFETCGDCHKDPHNKTATLAGKVVDCEKCHNVLGFSPSIMTVLQHRDTKYPLEGKHTEVKCALCHTKDDSKSGATKWGIAKVVIRPLFSKCTDCHKDEHGGQLAKRPNKGECGDCHRVQGWKPSTFGVTEHARLKLALDGRHADIECGDCHRGDRKLLPPLPKTVTLGKANVLIEVKEVECTACHLDPHKGRFAAGGERAKAEGCILCHNAKGFRPASAGVAVHAEFRFPLEGGHRAVACQSCHTEMKAPRPPKPRSTLVLSGTSFPSLKFEEKQQCDDCHKTPHGEQFTGRKGGEKCDVCHGADDFKPAARFDHNKDASFSLKGAHEKVACSECHPIDPASGADKRVIYRPVSGKCESCHGKEFK